jgi:hypothetical protein
VSTAIAMVTEDGREERDRSGPGIDPAVMLKVGITRETMERGEDDQTERWARSAFLKKSFDF